MGKNPPDLNEISVTHVLKLMGLLKTCIFYHVIYFKPCVDQWNNGVSTGKYGWCLATVYSEITLPVVLGAVALSGLLKTRQEEAFTASDIDNTTCICILGYTLPKYEVLNTWTNYSLISVLVHRGQIWPRLSSYGCPWLLIKSTQWGLNFWPQDHEICTPPPLPPTTLIWYCNVCFFN